MERDVQKLAVYIEAKLKRSVPELQLMRKLKLERDAQSERTPESK